MGAWSESDFEVKTGQYEASSLRFQADTLAVCLQFRHGAARGARGSVAAFAFKGAAPCAIAAAAPDAAPKIKEIFFLLLMKTYGAAPGVGFSNFFFKLIPSPLVNGSWRLLQDVAEAGPLEQL